MQKQPKSIINENDISNQLSKLNDYSEDDLVAMMIAAKIKIADSGIDLDELDSRTHISDVLNIKDKIDEKGQEINDLLKGFF